VANFFLDQSFWKFVGVKVGLIVMGVRVGGKFVGVKVGVRGWFVGVKVGSVYGR